MDAASKFARMSPLDGLFFFTSAISAYLPSRCRCSMAARNPRGGAIPAARSRRTLSGRSFLASAISSYL